MDRNDTNRKLEEARLREIQARTQKIEEETKKIRMSRWLDVFKALISVTKDGVSIFGNVQKMRDSTDSK